jgi:hypothetical protein
VKGTTKGSDQQAILITMMKRRIKRKELSVNLVIENVCVKK